MKTPPQPGKGMSVKVDQQLHDDLATMMTTGMNVSEAVREALAIVADGYRGAWASGRIPEGVIPQITHVMVRPYDGPRDAGNTPGSPVIPGGGGPR